jgi:hypothetical protein
MTYPLIDGHTYTVGQLRETEAALLKDQQSDQKLSAKLPPMTQPATGVGDGLPKYLRLAYLDTLGPS